MAYHPHSGNCSFEYLRDRFWVPLLCIMYTIPLSELLKSLGIHYHLYADDTQLYLTFDLEDVPEAVERWNMPSHALDHGWPKMFYA